MTNTRAKTHIAICKLNFPAVCVYCCSLVLPFGEHLHFIFFFSKEPWFCNVFTKAQQKRKLFFDFRVVEKKQSIIARRSPTVRLRCKKSFACVDDNWKSRRIVDKWSHEIGEVWWKSHDLVIDFEGGLRGFFLGLWYLQGVQGGLEICLKN
jgi:hypothetical protein